MANKELKIDHEISWKQDDSYYSRCDGAILYIYFNDRLIATWEIIRPLDVEATQSLMDNSCGQHASSIMKTS